MGNTTTVESSGWDGVERRAGGANPRRIGIVLTRVRRPTNMQSPPPRGAATPALEQHQYHERSGDALR